MNNCMKGKGKEIGKQWSQEHERHVSCCGNSSKKMWRHAWKGKRMAEEATVLIKKVQRWEAFMTVAGKVE